MENGNETKYENDDQQEFSPLLLVSNIDDATTVKKFRGGKRFVALLLLVVSATAAAAAAMKIGVNPLVSSFSALVCTKHHGKQGDWCDGIWYDACGGGLSCFMGGTHNYCVPMGQENACCGWSGLFSDDYASGVDCIKDFKCDSRNDGDDTEPTCHRKPFHGISGSHIFAKKGSCNVNTGKPANILIEADFIPPITPAF